MMLMMRSATTKNMVAIKDLAAKELEFRLANNLFLKSIEDWKKDETLEIIEFRKSFFDDCQGMNYFNFYWTSINFDDLSFVEILQAMVKTDD